MGATMHTRQRTPAVAVVPDVDASAIKMRATSASLVFSPKGRSATTLGTPSPPSESAFGPQQHHRTNPSQRDRDNDAPPPPFPPTPTTTTTHQDFCLACALPLLGGVHTAFFPATAHADRSPNSATTPTTRHNKHACERLHDSDSEHHQRAAYPDNDLILVRRPKAPAGPLSTRPWNLRSMARLLACCPRLCALWLCLSWPGRWWYMAATRRDQRHNLWSKKHVKHPLDAGA